MAGIIWYPLSRTLDTLEATDTLSDTLLPFDRLKSATRRYILGENGKPHFAVPAIPTRIEYVSDGWPALIETYEGMSDGRYTIGHVTIFHIGDAQELANW